MKFWYFRRTLFFSQRKKIIFGGKKHTALFQFWYFRRTLFLSQRNEIIFGVKSTLPFSKLIIGKYVYSHGYTEIRDRGASRVNLLGKLSFTF